MCAVLRYEASRGGKRGDVDLELWFLFEAPNCHFLLQSLKNRYPKARTSDRERE